MTRWTDALSRTRSGRRIRSAGPVTLGAVVAGSLVLAALAGTGTPPVELRQASSGAWLAWQSTGVVTLVDGPAREVAADVPVAPAGHRLLVQQVGSSALVADPDAGVVYRVDGATLDPAGRQFDDGSPVSVATGGDTSYVIDPQARKVHRIDPRTLKSRYEFPADADPGTHQAVVDDDGRLWLVDSRQGGLSWFDSTAHETVQGVSAGAQLLLVRGRPFLVSPDKRSVAALDPSGRTGTEACLDLPTGADAVVLGSSTTDEVYAVASGTDQLVISTVGAGCRSRVVSDLAETDDPVAITAMAQVDQYVAAYNGETGVVAIVNTRTATVSRVALADVGHDVELVAKDDLVFYNDLQGARAGVLAREGSQWTDTPVEKGATPELPGAAPGGAAAAPPGEDESPEPDPSERPGSTPSSSPTDSGPAGRDGPPAAGSDRPRPPGQARGPSVTTPPEEDEEDRPCSGDAAPVMRKGQTLGGVTTEEGTVEVEATRTLKFTATTDCPIDSWTRAELPREGLESAFYTADVSDRTEVSFDVTFTVEGEHIVSATATRGERTSKPLRWTVVVGPAPEGPITVSDITCDPPAPERGVPVTCSAAASGSVSGWEWEIYKDGSPEPIHTDSSAGSVSYTFSEVGDFTVTLTVTRGRHPDTTTATGDRQLHVSPRRHALTLDVTGPGKVVVSVNDEPCANPCRPEEDDRVIVAPSVALPLVFDYWGDGDAAKEAEDGLCTVPDPGFNSCTFTMPAADALVRATFHAQGRIEIKDDCDRVLWRKDFEVADVGSGVRITLVVPRPIWWKGLDIPFVGEGTRNDTQNPDLWAETAREHSKTFPDPDPGEVDVNTSVRFFKEKGFGVGRKAFTATPDYTIGYLPPGTALTFTWVQDRC